MERVIRRHTWLVQTLLNVTNAKVWASIDVARSALAVMSGMRTHDSRSWGRKATDSTRSPEEEEAGVADARYSWMLYGLKLCLWSMRVTWWR